jgi:PAS domain S-box-containing protein
VKPRNPSDLASASGMHDRGRDHLALIVTTIIGLGCTGGSFYLARAWETERHQVQFEKLANERHQELQRAINGSLEVLYSLASFFLGSPYVERAEFRTFVAGALARRPEIFSLQWRPRVLAAERPAFEARVRAEGFPHFEVRDATAAGRVVRAPERPEYFPILYGEPLHHNLAMLGLDQSDDPEHRRVLDDRLRRSAHTAMPVAGGGLDVYERWSEVRDPFEIVVFLPVYGNDATPQSEEQRVGRLAGFVTAILRVGRLLEGTLRGYPASGLDIVVLDEPPQAPAEASDGRGSRSVGRASSALPEESQDRGLSWKRTVHIAGGTLSLLYLASDPPGTPIAWGAAASVLLLFAVTNGFLWSSLRRTREIQGLATELSGEITERERSERSLRESEARLQRQTAALLDLASEPFLRPQDAGEMMRRTTERVACTLEAARVSLWRFTDGDSKLECVHFFEREGNRHSSGQVLTVADYPTYFGALREGRVLAAHDARRDPRTRELVDSYLVPFGVTSMLDAPLRLGDALIGVICHEHTGAERRWTLDEQSFAGSVADLVSLAYALWEHSRTRSALERSEERYRSLVTAISQIVWTLSPSGEATVPVPSWEAFTGQHDGGGLGMGWLAAIHPEDRERIARHWLDPATQMKGLDEAEFRLRRHDGVYCLMQARAAPVREADGSIREWVGACWDITEQREAERALARSHLELERRVVDRTRELRAANERLQELDRLKSEFLATMSHELRTPLNSIIGFTGILQQGIAGPVNEEQHKQLSMVYTSAKHLLTLINDLLDLSRIESGRMEFARDWLRAEEVVTEVVQVLAPMAAQKDIGISAEIPRDIPEIYGDRKRVFQILLNLANNAVKFTERGEVQIACRADGAVLEMSVTDTGIGIKPENMELLFEAFRQVEGSAQRRYEGTGLGLHLSRRLAKLLGGDIRAESEYGKGSRFILSLPLV